jgi:hypothetical protein
MSSGALPLAVEEAETLRTSRISPMPAEIATARLASGSPLRPTRQITVKVGD